MLGRAIAMAAALSIPGACGTLEPSAPAVLYTFPIAGATIAPGQTELVVTFDRPMRPSGWSYVMESPDTFPPMTGQPRQTRDDTFRAPVRLEPGRVYVVWFNSDANQNFRDKANIPAKPFRLEFRTQAQ